MQNVYVRKMEVEIVHVEQFVMNVTLPEVQEYAQVYPHYGPRASGEGRAMFDLVMRPEVFVACAVLSRVSGEPAVKAVAGELNQLVGGQLADTDKQFAGTMVCRLMELNGFRKRNKKGAIGVTGWGRGELYEPDV